MRVWRLGWLIRRFCQQRIRVAKVGYHVSQGAFYMSNIYTYYSYIFWSSFELGIQSSKGDLLNTPLRMETFEFFFLLCSVYLLIWVFGRLNRTIAVGLIDSVKGKNTEAYVGYTLRFESLVHKRLRENGILLFCHGGFLYSHKLLHS